MVWIIPTPSLPKVEKANEEIFENIAELAMPQKEYATGDFGTFSGNLQEKAGVVVVIETKKVDYYEVTTLVSSDKDTLVKWFNENNYSYPEEYSYVLEYYINKNWFFTAIKVSPESQGSTEVIEDLKEGHPTPIKMEFLSDQIVFPLKISSVEFPPEEYESLYGPAKDEPVGTTREDKDGNIWTKQDSNDWVIEEKDLYGEWIDGTPTGNRGYQSTTWGNLMIDEQPGGINYESPDASYRYDNYVPIQIFILADNRYEADNFYTQYGNWVTKEQIENLGYSEDGNFLIHPSEEEYFLTSLYTDYEKSEMNNDIYFRKSSDNKTIGTGPELWEIFVGALIFALILFLIWSFTIGLLFIIGAFILFLSSNRTARIIAWILQITSVSLTVIGLLLGFLLALLENSLNNSYFISFLITSLLLIGIMAFIIRLEKRHNK